MLLTSSGSRPLSFPLGRCTVGAMVLLLQFVFLAGVANEAPFISRIRTHFALAVVAPRLSRAATMGCIRSNRTKCTLSVGAPASLLWLLPRFEYYHHCPS